MVATFEKCLQNRLSYITILSWLPKNPEVIIIIPPHKNTPFTLQWYAEGTRPHAHTISSECHSPCRWNHYPFLSFHSTSPQLRTRIWVSGACFYILLWISSTGQSPFLFFQFLQLILQPHPLFSWWLLGYFFATEGSGHSRLHCGQTGTMNLGQHISLCCVLLSTCHAA